MRTRGATTREAARRILTFVLALLFVCQPIARASSACSIWARLAGPEGCCCAASEAPVAPSCCAGEQGDAPAVEAAAAADSRPASGVSRCGCEVRGPAPSPAVPRDADARVLEAGGDERGLGSAARAPGFLALDAGAAPAGEVALARLARLRPRSSVPTPTLARGSIDLLVVICVARC